MSDLRVECTECGYQWTPCHLPIVVLDLALLMTRATCIQCGAAAESIRAISAPAGRPS